LTKILKIASLIIVFGLLVMVVFLLHPFGSPPSVMDDYIIENAQSQIGTNETVTSIVFDYRGYDTLGEAIILTAAVSGVVMIFRKEETTKDAK
jgi:multisubunit Na+/H+ antiporter MnhB subunit